ncbi:hypothetical protein [Alteromonas sp. ASW11-130]|uniref:hypothetical protein n=1 Tax=Alteromonas sp. ASW11-130 TaxID=3015775 RepID=UPI00224255FE|nr:hypothetical protein [Alteromonas sp. ASW11-130]MCW8092957.1 hypothetical protein [Alteromonas sp. ASW11-130]
MQFVNIKTLLRISAALFFLDSCWQIFFPDHLSSFKDSLQTGLLFLIFAELNDQSNATKSAKAEKEPHEYS